MDWQVLNTICILQSSDSKTNH